MLTGHCDGQLLVGSLDGRYGGLDFSIFKVVVSGPRLCMVRLRLSKSNPAVSANPTDAVYVYSYLLRADAAFPFRATTVS